MAAAVLLTGSVLGAALGLTFTPMSALAGDASVRTRVVYEDLDLGSEAGAMTLARRIVAASRRVCVETGPPGRGGASLVVQCRRRAVRQALERLVSPWREVHPAFYPTLSALMG